MALFISKPIKTLTCVILGFLIRLLVMAYFKETIRQRVEVTTPIGSWKRAYEGVHLWNSGLNPYSGNILHEYPISLQFYKIIISYFNVDLAFAATDILTAILLQYSVYNHVILTSSSTGESNSLDEAKSKSFKVLITYLFSPITIISCAGTSTSIFTNFLISVIISILPMKPFKALTCVLCAFLACNNLHYAGLIVPIFLCLEYCDLENRKNGSKQAATRSGGNRNQEKSANQELSSNTTTTYYQEPNFYSSISTSATIFLTTLLTLILTSYLLMGRSWSFLESTYLFVLKIQDQTPNIGMFWYFFTEVFETFLDFFAWTMQINAFIHVIPLSINLRDEPFFLLYINILTSTIFQPYPSLANIGLITSLLPQWSHLYQYMRRGLIVICAGVVCMSLCPIFWHLWIMMGTANSNFYFGATLAFTVSLILFMNDILSAYGYSNAKIKFGHYKKTIPECILNDEKTIHSN